MDVTMRIEFPPGLMTRAQAAYYLGMSPTTLDVKRRAGLIIPVSDGGPKFPKEECDRYIKSLMVEAVAV